MTRCLTLVPPVLVTEPAIEIEAVRLLTYWAPDPALQPLGGIGPRKDDPTEGSDRDARQPTPTA